MQTSIFKSGIRAFVVTLSTVFAALLAILLFFVVIALYEDEEDISSDMKISIQPNAHGIRKKQPDSAPVILKMKLEGVIGTELLNGELFQKQLTESREGDLKNDRVKGILLVINSPGGGVIDADSIYRSLLQYKQRFNVPVYTYVDGMCASGGMYVACATDKIFASEASLIGSVGVIVSPILNYTKLLDKIGVDALTVMAGKDKDELNPFRPWKEGEADNLQKLVNVFYDQFVRVVSHGRPEISHEALVQDYGAKVFSSPEALEKGYIDGANVNESDALLALLSALAIKDDYYQVVELKKDDWVSTLFDTESFWRHGKIRHELVLPGGLDSRLKDPVLYLYQP